MAILVILVLVVLWAAVLIPPILRSRSSSGSGGISDFMDGLRSLGRHGHASSRRDGVLHGPVGGPTVGRRPSLVPGGSGARQPIAPPLAYRPMPGGVSPMQRRRRNVLVALVGAVVVTFLLALVGGWIFWALFLLAAALLGLYVYALVHLKQQVRARHAPPKRVFATPVDVEDDAPKVGDNVILLRRNVG